MFEFSRYSFLLVSIFLLSNYGAQCYYPQPAPYAPYSPYPYPYMGQYAPVQASSWSHFYSPYPYGPSAAVPAAVPAVVSTSLPAAEHYPPAVATPAPASKTRPEEPPSPSLPIIDFKKGSIIDYEYFYDTLPEDYQKTRIIIMLNKTSSATVTSTQAPLLSQPVFKPPSFEEVTEDRSTEEETKKVVTETTEMEEWPEEQSTTETDWNNEDVTEEPVTDEITEEPVDDTTVADDYQLEGDEDIFSTDDWQSYGNSQLSVKCIR